MFSILLSTLHAHRRQARSNQPGKSSGRTARKHLSATLAALLALTACSEDATYWSDSERALLHSISLQGLPDRPDSPSNVVASDPRAADLGKALFFDRRLSGAGNLSCASCHQPKRQFTDGLAQGRGVNALTRNTPSLIAGAWQSWFYWDGRRDSLWSQALIPIEAPDEMGGSRVGAVRLVASDPDYAKAYETIFGALPLTLQPANLPEHAGEFTDATGRNAWHRLPKKTQHAINAAYANIGKTIAAFERTLTPKPSRFDRYVETLFAQGEQDAEPLLSASAKRGAKLFIDTQKTRCLQCHNGALLTNGDFHNIGTGTLPETGQPARSGGALDFGRLLGVQAVLLDQFNCLGPHSDARKEQCSALRFLAKAQHSDLAGAYKTPSLRNASQTGPYMHDGRYRSLREIVEHYNTPPTNTAHELVALDLSEDQIDDLVAFLESLESATYAQYIETAKDSSAGSASSEHD